MKILSFQELLDHLEKVSGRAKVRTLGKSDLVRAVLRSKDGPEAVCAASVAHSYGYRAFRMRLGVRRLRKHYAVKVDWGNAQKGCSEVPGGGPRDVWRAWILIANRKDLQKAGYVFLDGKSAEEAIRRFQEQESIRASLRELNLRYSFPEQFRSIPLTWKLGKEAGCCETGLRKVQSWFPGKIEVSAEEIFRELRVRNCEGWIPYLSRVLQLVLTRELEKAG